MNLTIEGKLTKLSKSEALLATDIFAKKLMTSRMVNTLSINIIFKPMPVFKGLSAWVYDNDRPKDFEILINNKHGKKMQLLTLAHEMVHVKQWATGQMKDLVMKRNTVRYNNKYYDAEEDYFFQPWEVEAFGLETGLYLHFKEQQKNLTRSDNS